MAIAKQKSAPKGPPGTHQPYVSDNEKMSEFTWSAVFLGTFLGIIFGASSLYLVLKVGLTVSASIPVAVLSITLFRLFSRAFGMRRATILENNIVQTTGSAGESIAFGVGVTMPALLLLGFEMELTRVMTVGVLGGLLGILMMIPLRRAFIVQQHGKLQYPEGTACADVLIVGEEGGATAKTVFAGFGIGILYKLGNSLLHLWKEVPAQPLYTEDGKGLRGGVLDCDVSPELLGVGYIIGPRIASIMVAGGVLAYLVLLPMIVLFSGSQGEPLKPASKLIRDMSTREIRENYILYIGAGAVATGGFISMMQALPLIFSSIAAGLREVRGSKGSEGATRQQVPRTQQDLPLWIVLVGSVAMILAITCIPALGMGFDQHGFTGAAVGAALIVLFGFLFVTVSARLTGEIGSSSNPISGMTVATLMLTCLVFLFMGKTDRYAMLSALSVAAIVCIAASNGGTTAQDLKTGYLVGGTPRLQQYGILIGALTSAVLIGMTLLALNEASTVYSKLPHNVPQYRVPNVHDLTQMRQVGGEYKGQDTRMYHVLHATEGQYQGIPSGKYLVDDQGVIRYLVDPAIGGRLRTHDKDYRPNPDDEDPHTFVQRFAAPKTRLMAIIIDGILNQRLPWGFVLIGVLIAVTLELAGVAALPFAVGVYLPLEVSAPIFIGGILRWFVDKIQKRPAQESDMSPGVLLSSGYIAGGTIGGVIIAFTNFMPDFRDKYLSLGHYVSKDWSASNWPALVAFGGLSILLIIVGLGKFLGGDAEDEKPEPKKMKLDIGSAATTPRTDRPS